MADLGDVEFELARADDPGSARPARPRVALAVAALVVMAALLAGVDGGGDDPELAAGGSTEEQLDLRLRQAEGSGDGSTSTSEGSTPTSTESGAGSAGTHDGSGADADGESGVTVDSSEPPTTDAPTTTTTLPCTVLLNSFEPGCGAFRWTSAPQANQPVVATIELITQNPVLGQPIRFRVTASDPDAVPYIYPIVDFDYVEDGLWDPPITPRTCFNGSGAKAGYGPWETPIPALGEAIALPEGKLKTQFPTGRYVARACIRSHSWGTPAGADDWCPGDPAWEMFEEKYVCRDPYTSVAQPSLEFTVAPAP